MSTIDSPREGRVPGSLEPVVFDMIEYEYPDELTVVEVYSFTGPKGVSYIKGIIYYTYADSAHTRLLKKWRINCG